MGLNIKNEEAHRLAAEVAQLANETLTEAVIVSLRERREKLQAKTNSEKAILRQELFAIIDSAAEKLKGSSIYSTDDLYDEHGLPK
jgi:antitoxin VapB